MRTPTMLSWAIREAVACDRQPANECELLAFAVGGCGSGSPARTSLMQYALTLVFSTPLNLTPISRLALRRRNKDCRGSLDRQSGGARHCRLCLSIRWLEVSAFGEHERCRHVIAHKLIKLLHRKQLLFDAKCRQFFPNRG